MLTEEHKAKLKAGREAKKLAKLNEVPPNDLGKELAEFKEETSKKINTILEAVESLLNKDPKKEILPPVEEKLESEIVPLTAKQQEIFEYYFDPSDGFKAWYDINKNIFTIEVPRNMSNNNDAYWSLYKQDLRSKKVDQNNILGSVKDWCTMVAANLRYERRIRLK